MNEKIVKTNVKQLMQLIHDFKSDKNICAEEFLQCFCEANELKIPRHVAKMFLNYTRHENICVCLAEMFRKFYKFKDEEHQLLLTILYILIFELCEKHLEDIKVIVRQLKPTLCIELLKLINSDDFPVILTKISARIFENEYVIQKITQPFLKNIKLHEKLQKEVLDYYFTKRQAPDKIITVAVSPRWSKTSKSVLLTKSEDCAPVLKNICKPVMVKKVPITTYRENKCIKRNLEQAKMDNKIAALKLFEVAQRTKIKASNKCFPPPSTPVPLKVTSRKIPSFKSVEIKTTAAALMRHAALYEKSHEKSIKRINDLANGMFDDTLYEELEEEERKRLQKEHLQNIEKKHLQGLLTREEAILAKQNLLQANKEKMLKIKVEKEQLYYELDKWRKSEEAKMKLLVEKSQNIDKAAREAEKKIQAEKHRSAKNLQEETKKLLDEAMDIKQQELSNKITLIRELKALESLKNLNKKEFDPTETPNLGLFCEMSIVELQERLALMKLEFQEQLEARKKTVKESKLHRQELLRNAEEFIAQNHSLKKKSKKANSIEFEETPEINALKSKLNNLRALRTQKSQMAF